MFNILEAKRMPDGMVLDAIRGLLSSVQEHKVVTTQRGQASVQNFKISQPGTREYLLGACWDHADLSGLVGSQVIFVSIKANNGKFGGVSIRDSQDPAKPGVIYKNLSVSGSGVCHTPETYAAAFGKTPDAAAGPASATPTQASVPAPAQPATTAPKQAPVPAPATVPCASVAGEPTNVPATHPADLPTQAPVPECTKGENRLARPTPTHEKLAAYYAACFHDARAVIAPTPTMDEHQLTAIVAATATIFIAGVDLGLHVTITAPGCCELPKPGEKFPF